MTTEAKCTSCQAPIPAGSAFCNACGAQQPAGCASCGAALLPGAAFCGSCGASTSPAAAEAAAPETPAAPTACAKCGSALAPGSAFCGDCGTAAGATQAAPPPPTNCPTCNAPLREGKRFCRNCGSSVDAGAQAAAPAAAAQAGPRAAGQPQQISVQAMIDQLTWSTAAAGAGFILALISPFLAWVSVSGFSASAFEDNAVFRIGDILGDTETIDGLVAVFAALGGLALVIAFLAGRIDRTMGRNWIGGLGGVLVALSIIQMQYVASQDYLGFGDVGFGLYLLLIGGALAAASPWIPANPLKGRWDQ